MKGFWKRKLPACLLALAMMVSVVPRRLRGVGGFDV